MTTINLQTKHVADEPDRAKKLVAKGEARSYESKPEKHDPLKYVTDLGWTWDGAPDYYTWDEYLDMYHAHFPLEELALERRFTTKSGSLRLNDGLGDKLELKSSAYAGRIEISVLIGSGDERHGPVWVSGENLGKLRDFLNEHATELDRF